MLCSSGGEICTALNPAGPRTVSHSVAISVHFHSKRCTKTSPAAMCPLGRYVGASDGRGGGGFPPGGEGSELPHAATARTTNAVAAWQCPAHVPRAPRVARILCQLRVGN